MIPALALANADAMTPKVERTLAWILENRRLALRYDRLGFIVQSLLQSACIFLVAGRLARESGSQVGSEKRV